MHVQLLDIPDVGLLSSSLDSTVKVLDLARGAVTNTFALHRKAVRSMAYSRAFSLVARWVKNVSAETPGCFCNCLHSSD